MKLGIALPQVGHFADPRVTRSIAMQAEASGFDSLWVFDRILAPVEPQNPYPASADGMLPESHSVVLDPLLCLTLAASVTTSIRLGTSVLVAPWYSPVLLSRSLTTLDRISNGRVDAGLGIGWSIDEYESVGVAASGLGARLDEQLDVLSSTQRDAVVELRTSRERIARCTIEPKPIQQHIPLLLAAYTPHGFARIGRRADGWMAAGLPLEVMESMWQAIIESARSNSRDTGALRFVVRANVKLTPSSLGDDRPIFMGSLDQIRDDIKRTAGIGATELVLDVQDTCTSVTQMTNLISALTERVWRGESAGASSSSSNDRYFLASMNPCAV